MYLPITDGFMAFKDSILHTIPASAMRTRTFLLQTVLWFLKILKFLQFLPIQWGHVPSYYRRFCGFQRFLTSYHSCLYNVDVYVSITDGFVVSKDSKLYTIPACTMRTCRFLLQTVL